MLFGTQTLVAALAVSLCFAADTTNAPVTPPATTPATTPATPPITQTAPPAKDNWIPAMFTKALEDEDGPLDVSKFRYMGDGHHKSRSPCPFLNTAANHDIIQYHGKNINVQVFQRLLKKAGVPSLMTKGLVDAVYMVARLNNVKDSSRPTDAIDLEDLNAHGIIEHDLSISRLDVITPTPGDNFPTPGLFDRFLNYLKDFDNISDKEVKDPLDIQINVPALGAWHNERRRIEVDERKHTPDESYKAQFLGSGECFLLLYVLGKNGEIGAKDAKSFLVDERFPKDWTPPTGLTIWTVLKGTTDCALAYHSNGRVLAMIEKEGSFLTAFKDIFAKIRSWL